ncbi:MAG: flavin reductase family protein [Pseudomonadota bacterium]
MSRALRDALGCFATGVAVVTAQNTDPPHIPDAPQDGIRDRGEDMGLTCNSFSAVSLEPPLVLWCLRHASMSNAAYCRADSFCVNVLAGGQEDLAHRFTQNDHAARFDRLAIARTPSGNAYLPSVQVWFDCRVQQIIPAGDHDVFIGEVTDFAQGTGQGGLLFYRGDYMTSDAFGVWR